jgi:hypothetical protein
VFPGAPVEFEVLADADDGGGVGVAEVRLRIDGTAWIDALGRTGDQVPPYRFGDLSFASDGMHVLELEAIDHFGNVAFANATILVGKVGDSETDTGGSGESDGGSATSGHVDVSDPGCSCATGPGCRPLSSLLWVVVLWGCSQMPWTTRGNSKSC